MGRPESERAPSSRVLSHGTIGDADDLDDVMAPNAGAVVIALWSRSCGACGAMAPAFETVAARFAHADVQFWSVETDAHPALVAALQVRSVPTVLFCLDGEVVFAIAGRFGTKCLTRQVEWLLARHEREGFLTRLFGFLHPGSPAERGRAAPKAAAR